jgi:hypothetical protein
MALNDDVTRKLDAQEVRILTAIGEVKQEVKHVKDKVIETSLVVARLDERQVAQKDRMDAFEDTVKSLKAWDRATAAIGAIFGPAIAFIISNFRREQ